MIIKPTANFLYLKKISRSIFTESKAIITTHFMAAKKKVAKKAAKKAPAKKKVAKKAAKKRR